MATRKPTAQGSRGVFGYTPASANNNARFLRSRMVKVRSAG